MRGSLVTMPALTALFGQPRAAPCASTKPTSARASSPACGNLPPDLTANLTPEGSDPAALGADHDGRLFVCGDQSGRTSAPISSQAVQTILGHKDRTGISSGRAS